MPSRSKCDDPKLQHCCQPLNLIKEVDIPILIQQLTVLRTVVSMHCLARAVLKNEYMFANVQRRPLLRRWQTLIASFRMSALPKAVRPHPLRAAFHVVGSRGAGNCAFKTYSVRVIGLLFAIYKSEVKHRLFAFIFFLLDTKCSNSKYPILILL